jgi:predicted amidophosphoribosyltransferase
MTNSFLCPYCGLPCDDFDAEYGYCPRCGADLRDEDIELEEQEFREITFED